MIYDDFLHAYLDDFNKILVTIDKRFCDGQTDKLYLLENEEISELKILEHNCDDKIDYYYVETKDDVFIGLEYEVMVVNGRRCPLEYRFVVKKERFDALFGYNGDDLGAIINGKMTTFNLWAPTASEVKLVMEYMGNKITYEMLRGEKGVYRLAFNQDLSTALYYYLVKVNGVFNEIIDPYGKFCTPNGKKSAVYNYKALRYEPVELKTCADPIIYEVGVQDYTKEKTFKAMSLDLDYLKSLNITHVQLLPINDFYSVDEYHKDIYYNWGYDPYQYQCLEGSYSSNILLPTQVVSDFGDLVQKMHLKGLRCNLDVVFNHMYSINLSQLEKCVPYYYFRWHNGALSNGTGCGNELDSKAYMVRKLIIDTLTYYVEQFDVDGFRFDLMSIIDVETLNQAAKKLKEIKPDIMLYGEGWNLKTSLPICEQASVANHAKLLPFAFFNDTFRDIIKGSTFDSQAKGYFSGQANLINSAAECIKGLLYTNSSQTINYVECHDNMTCFDKLRCCCKAENIDDIIARAKLMLAAVVLSQGIPFIHAGQEFCGSKDLKENTYNDAISNYLNPKERYKYQDVVNYLKNIISLRKELSIAKKNEEVLLDVSTITHKGTLEYIIKNCSKGQTITIIFNPTQKNYDHYFNMPMMLLFLQDEKTHQLVTSYITVPALSIAILGSDIND